VTQNIDDRALRLPIHALNAGLCISRGMGRHPDRVIDSYELIYVREGVLEMAEEETEFTVAAGQSLILYQGKRHQGRSPYDRHLSYYWIHFHVADSGQGRNYAAALSQHTTVRRPEHLTDLFRRFLDDQETHELTPDTANLLLLLMLHEVGSSIVHDEVSGPPSAGRVLASRAEAYIATHFHENISTARIAAVLSCNADYLSRVFQQTFAITVTESILRHRMKKARVFLRDTDIYPEQVAQQCGIEDVAYFRRIFKRETGMTPLAFRKIYARSPVNTE
jgi:AraC-like DNA-binding protein